MDDYNGVTPRIDGEHHAETPLLRDLYYQVIDGVPVLRGEE